MANERVGQEAQAVTELENVNLLELQDLIDEALEYERAAFESNEGVNGGDLLDWFASWRLDVAAAVNVNLRKLQDLINQALEYEREAFESNVSVDGGDLLDWFARWRLDISAAVSCKAAGPKVTEVGRIRGEG